MNNGNMEQLERDLQMVLVYGDIEEILVGIWMVDSVGIGSSKLHVGILDF